MNVSVDQRETSLYVFICLLSVTKYHMLTIINNAIYEKIEHLTVYENVVKTTEIALNNWMVRISFG